MSADNWAICPQCTARHEAEAERLSSELQAAYGKVPVDKWHAMHARKEDAAKPLDKRTFREDYDISGAEEGVIEVSYCGGCNVCKLQVSFKHKHPIAIAKATGK